MQRRQFVRHAAILPLIPAMMKLKDLHALGEPFADTDPMPVLFVGHGSPMNAIEDNRYSRTWKQMGKTLPKPHAILCISAHWETKGTKITAMEKPQTIHDFGGFPQELFDVQYPAPGNLALATETASMIKKTTVALDDQWGLDHGCWSVVKNFYPDADIPVLQMSMDYMQSPQYHYELAKELAWLRRKGILIIGSGNIVHNLGMVAWNKLNEPGYAYDWATEANEKVKALILAKDHNSLINYRSLGKAINLAAPSPDHFLPLLYSLALQEENDSVSFFNDEAMGGSLTMTSVMIGM